MGCGELTLDLGALAANWRALDAMTSDDCETAAVVKADGYGLGAGRVAKALAEAGARSFFVAMTEEGEAVRAALGRGPRIFVFAGHMPGDADMIRDLDLIPMLNSIDQATRHFQALPGVPFGLQLDTGMNRLGIEPADWEAARDILLAQSPELIISHLACADEFEHLMNLRQLDTFRDMTDGLDVPRSLAATGGTLLGREWHFDMIRPGIGLYGGLPFADARPVAYLSLPVIQTRTVETGETVGYGGTWQADCRSRVATVAGGYADGIIRRMGGKAVLYAGNVPCPLLGRVSMDLLTVDVTHLDDVPDTLDLLGEHQGVDDLAEEAGTIGYEILTSLGPRYRRIYLD